MRLPVELEPCTDRQGRVVLQGSPYGHILRITLGDKAEADEFAAVVACRYNAHADDKEHPFFQQGFLCGWAAARKRYAEILADALRLVEEASPDAT